jgi:nuclear pore complex protein Nup133
MFSPEATVQGGRSSLRNNPRRRQRKDSDAVQNPRRKRSKIAEDTFQLNGDAHVNGNGSAMIRSPNGHAEEESSLVLSIPVRERKSTGKRVLKDDTTHYLVCQLEFVV